LTQTAARKGKLEAYDTVMKIFDRHIRNLGKTRRVLQEILKSGNETGLWSRYDRAIKALDINILGDLWHEELAAHPFPITLESLKFNWNYMKNMA